jgi:hypothetical protein
MREKMIHYLKHGNEYQTNQAIKYFMGNFN